MLAPLFQSRVRVIQEVLPTAHEPLLVLTEEYETYYLKYHKAAYNAHEMQAEWLCAALLREWNIPTPDVAVLTVEKAIISNLPRNAKRASLYLQKPCFGSKSIFGAQDSSELLNGQIELETLSNAEDLVLYASP
ncbi:HipA family kinase [Hymenobacter psychrophilus]|uniref:HipA family kinase n=1 Tax=Hymenobacter psychrophilus TaxID=651662 RepID=UPI001114D38B|nr:HipA family kinase [Hymenobacter psychrophilus]